MIKISEHLAKDILAHLQCDTIETCAACRLEHTDCDENLCTCAKKLQEALAAAEQNESVSQETVVNNAVLVAEPENATKYITISVAEYHCLAKAATLLEIIMAAKTYSVEAVVDAVRETVKEMVQQAEAGAAE